MDTDAIEIKYGLPKALPTIQNGKLLHYLLYIFNIEEIM